MAKMTVKGRQYFYARVANTMLNEAGQAMFYKGFYWRIHFHGFLTHEILDRTEAELARLINKKEYRNEGNV